MGNFKDEVKKLLGMDQEPAQPKEPAQQDPPAPGDPNTPPEPGTDPAPKDLTPEAINQIIEDRLAKERAAMAGEVAEVLKEFKGDGTPATGSPAQPTNTVADFGAWNAEIKAIEERNKNN